ncbi:uncharacterized protein LOC114938350 [Nylanderia fulva]|uniref:uncharacterized protein LOC114938350 n=1 Tax=Nylanderia fulva TaxID=613905 RepID=UPI0010FB8EC0|nr:uncharacterized protein LOC114938350 [Nylanderia fulva]
MRLLCLSLALAIICTIAIVRAPIVEARAAKSDEKTPPEKPPPEASSSASSSSEEDMSIPAKPVTPEEAIEAYALSIPTILGGLSWTEKAFQTMYNNSMHIASKIKDYPEVAAMVKAYYTKSTTW